MGAHWIRPAAWTIILVVTGFWLWFGIASAAGERLGPGNWIMHLLVPGGVFAATAAVAWRWPSIGAALLILEGLAVAIAYPVMFGPRFPVTTVVVMLATLAAPPIVAGWLLLLGARRAIPDAAP